MKKRGFTLIELLAVIAILAILVIIAMPNILKMYRTAKQNSFATEVQNLVRSAENKYLSDSINTQVANLCFDSSTNKLSTTGRNNIIYKIELSSNGAIIEVSARDDEFELIASSASGIKKDDIGNKYKVSDAQSQILDCNGNELVGNKKTLGEYVMENAKNKTCSLNGKKSPLYTTDTKCNDAGAATPPMINYLSGTNECLNFNYVWYSGKMWRIIEILKDGTVKMISEDILSAINFGMTASFKDSFMKQWLNEDFLDTLYNHQNILVTNATWDISPSYSWCYKKPAVTDTDKATVGLLNTYEFTKINNGYNENSFLNVGHSWWLSSHYLSNTDVYAIDKYSITGVVVPNSSFGIRPVVVLKADVRYSGKGTKNDPFVLLDDKSAAKSGDKINTRVSGEYVEVNGMLYRIVNTHNEDGKLVTKLSSVNYITDETGKVLVKKFGAMSGMPNYGDIVKSKKEQYWGAYLNGSWLTEDLKKYLVEDTYYVDNAQNKATDGSVIGSYKNTICKDKNTTATTKNCEKTAKTWKGYVGLPIVGELFDYPLGGKDTHDYLTATMTPYGDGSWPMVGAFEPDAKGIFQETYDQDFAAKPSITLNENVIITGGDGKTPTTAFKIAIE